MRLEVDGVTVGYGGEPVVRDCTFGLASGRIGCLLGPSGCGKTTLLRAIAGFEPVDAGRIVLGEREMSRPGRAEAPERRGVGMVFQDFALFPHLSIEQNVGFGIQGWRRSDRRERVLRLLALAGLSAYGRAYPHQLSGGQQQRVALARALAPRPGLLLLDEPFSGLDVELREGLAREVRTILEEEGITALMVTHDQMEAFAMADEVGVMEAGRLRQWDSGYNLYHFPADRFVADFIGQGVFLPGTVTGDGSIETELGALRGTLPPGCGPGSHVEVLLRPDDVVDTEAGIAATVVERAFRGAEFLYWLALPSGARVPCLTHSHHNYPVGEHICVRAEGARVAVFPR